MNVSLLTDSSYTPVEASEAMIGGSRRRKTASGTFLTGTSLLEEDPAGRRVIASLVSFCSFKDLAAPCSLYEAVWLT